MRNWVLEFTKTRTCCDSNLFQNTLYVIVVFVKELQVLKCFQQAHQRYWYCRLKFVLYFQDNLLEFHSWLGSAVSTSISSKGTKLQLFRGTSIRLSRKDSNRFLSSSKVSISFSRKTFAPWKQLKVVALIISFHEAADNCNPGRTEIYGESSVWSKILFITLNKFLC